MKSQIKLYILLILLLGGLIIQTYRATVLQLQIVSVSQAEQIQNVRDKLITGLLLVNEKKNREEIQKLKYQLQLIPKKPSPITPIKRTHFYVALNEDR